MIFFFYSSTVKGFHYTAHDNTQFGSSIIHSPPPPTRTFKLPESEKKERKNQQQKQARKEKSNYFVEKFYELFNAKHVRVAPSHSPQSCVFFSSSSLRTLSFFASGEKESVCTVCRKNKKNSFPFKFVCTWNFSLPFFSVLSFSSCVCWYRTEIVSLEGMGKERKIYWLDFGLSWIIFFSLVFFCSWKCWLYCRRSRETERGTLLDLMRRGLIDGLDGRRVVGKRSGTWWWLLWRGWQVGTGVCKCV